MNIRSTSPQAEDGSEQQGEVGVTSNDDLGLEALERRQLESDDLNREISGTQHSKHARFFNAYDDESDPRRQRKDRASTRDAHLTALQQMLTDPGYRALYEDTLDKLRRAQLAADAARDKADLVLEQAQVDMQAIREDANRLAGGSRVYVDAQGNVRREDGSIVAAADLEGVTWNDNAPSYEDYAAQAASLEAAHINVETITAHQTDLADADAALNDPNNPLSPEELEAIQQTIDRGMPDHAKSGMEVSAKAAPPANASEIGIPTLG